jgi:hypothetical protein
MDTDYTTAITSVVALVLVLTGMVTYVLTRPSDLAPRTRWLLRQAFGPWTPTDFQPFFDAMTNTPANEKDFNGSEAEIHMEQLKRAELFNGRAAMLGIVIGIVTEGLTGAGIAHQIGLGPLVDGYAACHTQFLPFCFWTLLLWIWADLSELN